MRVSGKQNSLFPLGPVIKCLLLFILKSAKQLVTNGVQPDIIESLDNEVREEHTTEQPEPIET